MVTANEVREAEAFARKQRMALAPLLQIDVTLGGDPEGAVRMRTHAMSGDPLKYERALATDRAAKLFAAGAVFFRRVA